MKEKYMTIKHPKKYSIPMFSPISGGIRKINKLIKRIVYKSIIALAIILDKFGKIMPKGIRKIWDRIVLRFFYAVIPSGELKHLVLRRQSYDYLDISPVTEESIHKVREAAKGIYGDKWSRYSDALRNDCVLTDEKCISELSSKFDKIDFLEIGSAQGLSTSIINQLIRDQNASGTCTSVDPYYEEGYSETGVNVQINKETRNNAAALYKSLNLDVDIVEKISFEGLTQLIREDKKYHLINIDGYNSGLNPTVDFGLSYSLLHKDGIIMVNNHAWPDVARVKSLCDRHCEKIAECWRIAAYRKV